MIQYTIKTHHGYDIVATFITDLPEHIIGRAYERWQDSYDDRWFVDFLKKEHPTAIIIEADSLRHETLYFE